MCLTESDKGDYMFNLELYLMGSIFNLYFFKLAPTETGTQDSYSTEKYMVAGVGFEGWVLKKRNLTTKWLQKFFDNQTAHIQHV